MSAPDPDEVLDAIEAEADVQALRARRAALLALIETVPGNEARERLRKRLRAREVALVPDEHERRRLLGDEDGPDEDETERKVKP